MGTRNCLAMALMATAFGLHAAGAAEYRVIVVGPAGSSASAVNSAGVVAGRYATGPGTYRAFFSRGAGWVDLGQVTGDSAWAVAINDRGQVLGTWHTPDNQFRGVIWYRGRTYDLGTIPGRRLTFYADLNNAGYAVAEAREDGPSRSFLRAPNGALTDIGNLPDSNPVTAATALNDRNQVTGGSGAFTLPNIQYRAFTWTRGVMRDVGDIGSAPNVGAAINDRGQVTGYVSVPGAYPDRLAFLYTQGRLRVIDARPAGVERYSEGAGINNAGHAVGDSNHLFGWVYRGRRMQSLTALVDPAGGWTIQAPRAINDAGQIAATGTRNGQQYAVRLDPLRPSLEALPQVEQDADAPAPEQVTPTAPAPEAAPPAQ